MAIRGVPPGINDPNLRGFLNDVRNALVGVSEKVTKISSTSSSGTGGGGTPTPTPGPSPTPTPTPGPGGGDGYNPPPPTSLTATADYWAIVVSWTNPVIPDLAGTEIWARGTYNDWDAATTYTFNSLVKSGSTVYKSKTNNNLNHAVTDTTWWTQTTLTVMTERVKVAELLGTQYTFTGLPGSDLLSPDSVWYFWARNHDTENLYSTYFPDDDVGVRGTTLLDPGRYIDLLTGSITETQLYKDLGARINLIDGPLDMPNSVANRVAAEAKARADGLAAEALARDTGITNESTVRKSADDQLAQTITIVNAKADSAAAAVTSEQTARVNADGALGQRIDTVVATSNGNTAAITSEATARANADGALSQRIDTVVATTNNNTAAISTEITARTTADSAMSQRIDVVVAKTDANAAAVTSEATARSNADGALGSRIDQVQAKANDNSALISDINTSRIGYCTIGATTTEHGDRASCQAAGGYWHTGLPWATAVKQVSVSDGTSTASLEQRFTAQKDTNNQLNAQYTVKIDNSGFVSGFGLASTPSINGRPTSDFGIRSDRFYIAPPTVPGGDLAATNIPFIVTTTWQTINGQAVPPGTYIKDAYIQNGVITSAKIGDAQITNAKIANYISSNDFNGNPDWPAGNPGTAGWVISKNGDAVFNTVLVRGPSSIGNNSIGSATTLTGQGSYFFYGTASFSIYGGYTPKTPQWKTATMVITVDVETANPTQVIALNTYGNDGSYNYQTLFNKGQDIMQKGYSGTVCFHFLVSATYYWWTVDITNSSNGRAGNPRLTLMEIVS